MPLVNQQQFCAGFQTGFCQQSQGEQSDLPDSLIRRALGTLLVLLLVNGCATNPVTGKNELALVSKAQEIAIGEEQYVPSQQMEGGQYTVDKALTAYVQEVGQRLAAVSDTELPFEFVVLNNSTPNAWALPGGKIAINRGLLVSLDNEAELAAVLGHEIVHAAARHGARSMERGMLLQGAVALTAIGLQDSEYANTILGGASVGAQLITQRYGREAELEADLYGMQYMARVGYDPASAISLQEKFVALNEGRTTGWLEGLFASHPPSQLRVDTNIETSAALKSAETQDWEVGGQRYNDQLAYLNSKSEAYQAFDQAMALRAKKENDVARRRVEHALQIEPKEPRFYGLKANLMLGEKDFDGAIAQYSAALQRDDAYFEYFLGRGLAYSRLGKRGEAKSDLERSTTLLPTVLAANELGSLSLAAGDRESAKAYFRQAASENSPLGQQAAMTFTRLDLADDPAKYFQISPSVNKDQLLIAVTNRSAIPISASTIVVMATVNGRQYQTQISGGAMAAGQQVLLNTGWRLEENDQIQALDARVISVAI